MNGTILSPLVVLGAAGPLGGGVVAAAAAAHWPLVAVDSDSSALHALAAAYPQAALTVLRGCARDETSAAELSAALRSLGLPLGGVVVAADGELLRGRLLDRPVEASCRHFEAALAPQLAAARHLLPLLADAGRGAGYVLVGGPGGVHPWAGYGHPSVTEAALRMLARVLHGEARPLGVRVQLLSLDTPAWGVHAGLPRADWPSALDVGRHALDLFAPGAPADAIVEFSAKRAVAVCRDISPRGCDLRDARALPGTVSKTSHHEVSP